MLRMLQATGVRNPGTYASGIAIHLARAAQRRLMQRRVIPDMAVIEPLTASRDPDALRQVLDGEKLDILRAVLAAMPRKYSELLARCLRGEEPADIQRAMGLTDKVYRLNKSKAKAMLRERIGHMPARRRWTFPRCSTGEIAAGGLGAG